MTIRLRNPKTLKEFCLAINPAFPEWITLALIIIGIILGIILDLKILGLI